MVVLTVAILAAVALSAPTLAGGTFTPSAGGAACLAPTVCAVPGPAVNVSAPLHGLVTTCASASSCSFAFNNSSGTGWAHASPPAISLRLPGEALASNNLSYSTYTAKLTGTYTYWTVGNFVGTDVNSGKVIYGTTNTNFTITCYGHSGRGGGCTYVYTTDNGTIVVYFTQADQTGASVSCSPSAISAGFSTTCTAVVQDVPNASATPVGTVSFTQAYGATTGFSGGGSCTLVSGSCSVIYTAPDDQLGTVPISVAYAGSTAFYPSSARTTIYVSGTGGGGSVFSDVLFLATGLPAGIPWTVTFAGLSLSSTNGTLDFQAQNGTYPFAVGSVAGYTVTPKAGNVTVAGDGQNVSLTFLGTSFPVSFIASGLPLGKFWSVTLDGATVNASSSVITFNASNGTHAFLIRGPAGFHVTGTAPTGVLTVSGAPVTEPVALVRGATFVVAFVERGLPRNTSWCVSLVSALCSSTPVLRFTNLTPGVYPYTVAAMVGQVITVRSGGATLPLDGNLTVTNHSLRILLRYVYPYPVTFTETGLPSGTNWSVTVAGVTEFSTTDTIVFELGNGTHYYRVGPVVGYVHSSSPAAARVLGAPSSVVVSFRP